MNKNARQKVPKYQSSNREKILLMRAEKRTGDER